MKHTDYLQERIRLTRKLIDELKAAVMAYGGKVSFLNDDILGPVLSDIGLCISSVALDDSRGIVVMVADEGLPKEERVETEYPFEDLDDMTIHYLIDMIDETEDTDDVTVIEDGECDPEILLALAEGCNFQGLTSIGVNPDEINRDILERTKALMKKKERDSGYLDMHEEINTFFIDELKAHKDLLNLD